MVRHWFAILVLLAASCTGDIVAPGAGAGLDIGPDADPAAPDAGAGTVGDAGAGLPDADPGPDANLARRALVCQRWNQDRADLSEGNWTGSVDPCNPGEISATGRANALRMVNLYRFLADLPPVTNDPSTDQGSQECALILHANRALSHSPPADWTCYSAAGAAAAGRSNIATTGGVRAIDLYMNDHGNESTLGHRRWILWPGLSTVGLGSTGSYSCLGVIGGGGGGSADWVAFPPPGPFPFQAVAPLFNYSLDASGWSVQSSRMSLQGAEVSVSAGGQTLPVTVTQLIGNYGNSSGISFVPDGWQTQAGTVYHVEISGIAQPFSYDVDVVDCSL